MFAGVGAGGQLARDRCLDQHVGVGDHGANSVDALVQVVLDEVEITVVAIGDLGGNVALADFVHVVGGDIQRPNHGVQSSIDSGDDLAKVAAVLAGVGAG